MSHRCQRWKLPGRTLSEGAAVQLSGQSDRVPSGNANRSMCLLSILLVSMIDQGRCLQASSRQHLSLPLVSPNKWTATLGSSSVALQTAHHWNPSAVVAAIQQHQPIIQLPELPRRPVFNANAKSRAANPTGQAIPTERHKRDADESELNSSIEAREVKQCFLDSDCTKEDSLNETSLAQVRCIDGKCQLTSSNTTEGKVVQQYISISQAITTFSTLQDNFAEGNMNPSKPSDNSLRMLPIMIILGIMFVGMCVAMNMFSRARFKNQRSIFSNPRILKLANANQQSGKAKSRSHRKLFLKAREQAMSHHAKHTNKVKASDESIEQDIESGSNEDIPCEAGLSAVVVASTMIASDLTETH